MLGSRLSQRGARFYGSSNPDAPLHWLKRGYLDKASVHLTHAGDVVLSDAEDRLDLARLSFLLTDNPHLPREYIDALTAEYQGLWRKRYVEGLWVAAEGSVYDMFDPDRHVVAECPVIKRWLCAGIDYGSMNPFHAVLLGIGIDRRIYAVAEWRWDSRARHRQLTDAEYSAKLTEWLASVQFPGSMLRGVTPERIIVDPAAASFRAQLTRDRYVPVLADNAVLDGIRTVSSLLATGRLLIHASCKYLIDEMQGYVWDEAAAAKGLDQPVKQDDHGADACRYGIFTTRGIWRNMLRAPDTPVNPEATFDLPGVAL
jgi:PBSX family phage terminase large subunit